VPARRLPRMSCAIDRATATACTCRVGGRGGAPVRETSLPPPTAPPYGRTVVLFRRCWESEAVMRPAPSTPTSKPIPASRQAKPRPRRTMAGGATCWVTLGASSDSPAKTRRIAESKSPGSLPVCAKDVLVELERGQYEDAGSFSVGSIMAGTKNAISWSRAVMFLATLLTGPCDGVLLESNRRLSQQSAVDQ
jgi:hypothetical protein